MSVKVTIATVARHADVSRQTVSNVLNAPDRVRPETRAKVQAVIDELGYRANLAARQMRTGRSRLIAVRIDPVGDDAEQTVLDRFLHGLTKAAAPAGYRVVLYTAGGGDAEIATYEELLASHALDAFVLTHTYRGDARTAWLAARGVPFTTFGRPWGAVETHPWVDVDGAAGTVAATRFLIESGHRRIGFVGWPAGSGVGDDRRRGWAQAMQQAGYNTGGLAWHTDNRMAQAEQLAGDLPGGRLRPTALVCASDTLALGVRQGATDLAVIGFDDTPMAKALGLSSVRQPLAEAAAECVHTLAILLGDDRSRDTSVGVIRDEPGGSLPRRVLLPPQLVIRHSG